MILKIIKTKQDWFEATWKEENTQIHCESFSGHAEHIQMFNIKVSEYGTKITVEQEQIIKEVKEAFVPVAQEEIDKMLLEQQKLEKELLRDNLMLQGKEYNGSIISFTKEDGDGVVQVKIAFEMGLQETIIHFKCGTKLPMKVQDFNEFALWFIQERDKFFSGDYNEN